MDAVALSLQKNFLTVEATMPLQHPGMLLRSAYGAEVRLCLKMLERHVSCRGGSELLQELTDGQQKPEGTVLISEDLGRVQPGFGKGDELEHFTFML
ncbi:MAG: hypothetical protein RDU25_00780 [Patescibacteria group bacterium]|nr:hypothetical protein [Patescibacteria group bacterium]